MHPDFLKKLYASHQACPTCPAPAEVVRFFDDLIGVLFSETSQLSHLTEAAFRAHVSSLENEFDRLLQYVPDCPDDHATITAALFEAIPVIHRMLHEDVDAMYAGDPAAKSRSEVIRSYPGFYAIAAYRIAHHLTTLGIHEIPRIITEHAHSRTGIDIHPGAHIGHHFCIDHGTGIVIGETSHIGNHVKVYQGVTLGALSVNKEDATRKRHPTIEDHVVIYAGATILGGETVIGHNSIIGGNVWLTRSVPAESKIYYQSKMYHGEAGETDVYILKAK
ncbi:MAG: serine acetyltransferase [Bacteroidota bacterium]